YRDRAVRAGIELIYNAPHFAAPMTADPDRIKQVFLNIIDNAVKYTNQNGTVIILAEFKDDNMLEIIISDNGCGIPEEDLPRIKEKFFKSNNTVRGSGIGLAVADEIVRLHNGELKINSKLGEGTTVTIALPVDSAPTEQEERGLVDEQE
ncbi:MAG: ATP-binding protein, partial [Clostridia bacterium]|nr:ATP-binding protein [Clostridia bacterium]